MLSVLSFPLYQTIYCQPDVSLCITLVPDVLQYSVLSLHHAVAMFLLHVCCLYLTIVFPSGFIYIASLSPFPEDVKASVREDSFVLLLYP